MVTQVEDLEDETAVETRAVSIVPKLLLFLNTGASCINVYARDKELTSDVNSGVIFMSVVPVWT